MTTSQLNLMSKCKSYNSGTWRSQHSTQRLGESFHRAVRPRKTTLGKHYLVVQARNRLLFHQDELRNVVQKAKLAAPDLAAGYSLTLAANDSRSQHILGCLKAQPGKLLKVGVINGSRATAELRSINDDGSLHLQVIETSDPLPTPPIDLLLALPRPKVLRRLWPVLGELGVRSVTLTGAARVEKTFFMAGAALEHEQVRAGLIKGLEQAGDTRMPDVMISKTLKGALLHMYQRAHKDHTSNTAQSTRGLTQGSMKEEKPAAVNRLPWGVQILVGETGCHGPLPSMADIVGSSRQTSQNNELKIVAHPYTDNSLMSCLREHFQNAPEGDGLDTVANDVGSHYLQALSVAIGPEGGWWEDEVELLNACGYQCVALGPRILTTTSACIALVTCAQQFLHDTKQQHHVQHKHA